MKYSTYIIGMVLLSVLVIVGMGAVILAVYLGLTGAPTGIGTECSFPVPTVTEKFN